MNDESAVPTSGEVYEYDMAVGCIGTLSGHDRVARGFIGRLEKEVERLRAELVLQKNNNLRIHAENKELKYLVDSLRPNTAAFREND